MKIGIKYMERQRREYVRVYSLPENRKKFYEAYNELLKALKTALPIIDENNGKRVTSKLVKNIVQALKAKKVNNVTIDLTIIYPHWHYMQYLIFSYKENLNKEKIAITLYLDNDTKRQDSSDILSTIAIMEKDYKYIQEIEENFPTLHDFENELEKHF